MKFFLKYCVLVLLVIFMFSVLLGCDFGKKDKLSGTKPEAKSETALSEKSKEVVNPEVVIFIVLDMVRSQQLSLCGYSKPTSSSLEKLTKLGASWTCDAYAPNAWTMPSHASYFTGLDSTVHGADHVFSEPLTSDGSIKFEGHALSPLNSKYKTLAEDFSSIGFQTMMVSANPVVSDWSKTGLAQGFQHIKETDEFGKLHGNKLVLALDDILKKHYDRTKPLFLFINIADAHHPWFAIPEGFKFLPPRIGLNTGHFEDNNPFTKYMRGELSKKETKLFKETIKDLYDYAVYRADRTLGRVVDLLYSKKMLSQNYRMIITSDHGEYLTEHNLISHFTFVYEQDTKVPLLYFSGKNKINFPKPVSATVSYDLVKDGKLPVSNRPVRAIGKPASLLVKKFGKRVNTTTAALWNENEKLMWIHNKYVKFDLLKDPGETNPMELEANHSKRREFEDYVKAAQKKPEQIEAPSKEMIEALRALGYTK